MRSPTTIPSPPRIRPTAPPLPSPVIPRKPLQRPNQSPRQNPPRRQNLPSQSQPNQNPQRLRLHQRHRSMSRSCPVLATPNRECAASLAGRCGSPCMGCSFHTWRLRRISPKHASRYRVQFGTTRRTRGLRGYQTPRLRNAGRIRRGLFSAPRLLTRPRTDGSCKARSNWSPTTIRPFRRASLWASSTTCSSGQASGMCSTLPWVDTRVGKSTIMVWVSI